MEITNFKKIEWLYGHLHFYSGSAFFRFLQSCKIFSQERRFLPLSIKYAVRNVHRFQPQLDKNEPGENSRCVLVAEVNLVDHFCPAEIAEERSSIKAICFASK